MVGWGGLARPTTTATMGAMVEILTPGVAILLQTPTVVVMAMVQHLVQTTIMRTMHTGMEKTVVTPDMADTEGMARLLTPPAIRREVVLPVIIMVVQPAGAGVEGGDHLFLIYMLNYLVRHNSDFISM